MKTACVELEAALKSFEQQEPQTDRHVEAQNKIQEMKKNIQYIKTQLDALSD